MTPQKAPKRSSPLVRFRGGLLAELPRRIWLTIRYRGLWETLKRALVFPLRLISSELDARARRQRSYGADLKAAAAWYRERGRPVTVVIPTYGDPTVTFDAVASIRRTTDARRVRVIVVDDGSEPLHQARLQTLQGAEVVLGERQLGFAANANRGLQLAQGDVVLMNSDMIAHASWLERLQYFAYYSKLHGIVGPKLLYPDRQIQFGGVQRNLGAPEWFDHRHRFRPADYGPAEIPATALAITGACMYIKRAVIDDIGLLDEGYPMAYEDVDYCLRAWDAGWHCVYYPRATLTHLESATRGMVQRAPELASQRRFWEKWSAWFQRDVRTADGGLRIIYVTEDTGVGGGHRDIFEHLNNLKARGHEVELYTIGPEPDWFELDAPVRSFETYEDLAADLAERDAIKVATWWNTAQWVWLASVCRGIPVFFVQDIETSYYPDSEDMRNQVLASYRPEFQYMTISEWNRDRLRELRVEPAVVPPGIDLNTFRPLAATPRRPGMLLALGRSNPLKNLPLTIAAWQALADPRPELCLFGIEPRLGRRRGVRYVERPSDAQVNELFNEATVFVQTSTHEGFCLPPLEAMATGAAVVCTDAHGNRDFCEDGVNCLIPDATVEAVSTAIRTLLGDPELRARLGQAGVLTAADYSWPKRIDQLEAFFERVVERGYSGGPGVGESVVADVGV